jgi:hypothetical protein
MHRWKMIPLVLAVTTLAVLGCSDDTTTPDKGRIDVGFAGAGGYVPDKSIMFDNLNFLNAAGQKYSITEFNFFLSNVEFYNTGSSLSHKTGEIHLFTVGSQESDYDDVISFWDVPAGTYNRIRFTFGLDDNDNVTGGLPPLTPFNNMAWPDSLGGGYHYMILNGLYVTDAGDTAGYATHTGRVNTTPHFFTVDLELIPSLVLGKSETWRIPLIFVTRQWYTDPNLYLFPADPFIMDDLDAQKTLQENGMMNMFLAGTPQSQPFP